MEKFVKLTATDGCNFYINTRYIEGFCNDGDSDSPTDIFVSRSGKLLQITVNSCPKVLLNLIRRAEND